MAKGESSFNTKKVEKKTYNFEPFPAGDYELKLIGTSAEVKKKQSDPKALPYVSLSFEALGTGEDGQKNKRVWHMLFCKTEPDKNGVVMAQRSDQLKGLADALGADVDIPYITASGKQVLSPMAIVKWLKTHDGEVVKGHVKVQAGTKDYPTPKNNISEFFEPGEKDAEGEDDEDEEVEETEEETEETEESEESDDEGDDESDEDDDDDSDGPDDDEDELEKEVKSKKTSKPAAKKKSKK